MRNININRHHIFGGKFYMWKKKDILLFEQIKTFMVVTLCQLDLNQLFNNHR